MSAGRAHGPELPRRRDVTDPMTSAKTRFQGRVLLVEDNAVNRLVAQTQLEEMGIDVCCATDGGEALAHLESERFDLVLMDRQLPTLDGLEAARRWRAHESAAGLARTPIVAVTAFALADDRASSLAAGMDEHLSKPYRGTDLAGLLARFLPAC